MKKVVESTKEDYCPPLATFNEFDYAREDLIFGRYPHLREIEAYGNEMYPCDTREAELIYYQTENKCFVPHGEFLCGSGHIYGEWFDAYYKTDDNKYFIYRFGRWWNRKDNLWSGDGYACIDTAKPELFAERYNDPHYIKVKQLW